MYNISDNNEFITYQLGDLKYYQHRMHLILIYDTEHTKSHCIYIYIY